jgi:predicted CopG family antitoxin
MLSKLFRSTPKWQSIKSQKRIEAIRELLPEQEKDLEILTQLAKEDSEPAVRREAVQKLHDLDILMQIQKRDLEAAVREASS